MTGLFFGSFNPIHWGHLAIAKTVLAQHLCDEVWLVLSPLNPWKAEASDLEEKERRLEILEKAIEKEEHIKSCTIEFTLPQPSYTWRTLDKLKEAYPGEQFSIIMGADNWNRFKRWAKWEQILADYPIIVYPRENTTPTTEDTPILTDIPNHARVTFIQGNLLHISSTAIRQGQVQD